MPKPTKRTKSAKVTVRAKTAKTTTKKAKPASAAERVRKHREKMRAAGLKPVTLWVWDTSRPGFAEECRRQSLLLRNDPHEKEVMDWLDQVRDVEGWEWNDESR